MGDAAHHGEVVADQHEGPTARDMIAGHVRDEPGRGTLGFLPLPRWLTNCQG